MLSLSDLFYLPEAHALVKELIADKAGLTVVAGIDPRPQSTLAPARAFLPSGRQGVFRILVDEALAAHPRVRCRVITRDEQLLRVPRRQRNRVELTLIEDENAYAEQIAAPTDAGFVILDRLNAANVAAALSAAQNGLRVIAQLDTVFRGPEVVRQLLELGAGEGQLGSLSWILSVQRMPALCPNCKQGGPPEPEQLELLRQRYPHLAELSAETQPGLLVFHQAKGCERCKHSGRYGDIALFDLYHGPPEQTDPIRRLSQLSMETYIWRLANQGRLALKDLLDFERDQSHRTFNLFAASERELLAANAQLNRHLAELEAAQRVMQQRTNALIALQELGQAMIAASESDPEALAAQICRHTQSLCEADRVILYGFNPPDRFDVIGLAGWDQKFIHREVKFKTLAEVARSEKTSPYGGMPPGVFSLGDRAYALLAGLGVPLRAQDALVGVMIVQTTSGARFKPGTEALLQTLASQAALALQRAGLVEQLRAKIEHLEAAQRELTEKDRLESEMEIARQVQQSVLPRRFPQVPGFRFAARNQPARQVGGDFYDLFALESGRFGVAIADVSGKGMPAALYMALTRSLLRAEARRMDAPGEVVSSLNRLLHELGEAQAFVTLFYGVVEPAERRLTYVRAGHDRPLLLRGGQVQELGATGAALGLLEPGAFILEEERLALQPGDRLVLYTDGMTDVVGPGERMFNLEQFKRVIEGCAGLEPEELCAVVFSDLAAYRGGTEQFDDMTMVVVAVD